MNATSATNPRGVSRDIVTDLLPLYFAGEASADTRALVEAYFADDPAFARRARTGAGVLPGLVPPARSTEMKSLERTRGLLRLRSWVLGVAIFCTATPLSGFSISGGSGAVFLWRERPDLAVALAVVALVAWTGYFILRQRLAVTRL